MVTHSMGLRMLDAVAKWIEEEWNRPKKGPWRREGVALCNSIDAEHDQSSREVHRMGRSRSGIA
jgi:hypothetical protein